MTTTFWSAFAGKAGQSAAFGPNSPFIEETKSTNLSKMLSVDDDITPRIRGVDIDGTKRSQSADSDVTLVEEGLYAPKCDSVGEERMSAGPSFTVDGNSAGIIYSNGQWQMTNQELHHRLQNISLYPSSTLVIARRHLIAELEHLLKQDDVVSPPDTSIMSLPTIFDIDTLDTFLQKQHDSTTFKFAFYSARRREARQKAREAGTSFINARSAGCEMFDQGKEQCIRWLEQASVVKYVDGSWLANLYRNTTGLSSSISKNIPIADQRKASRASWLVMSEELGDGDQARSHVAIYERLMNRLSERRGELAPPKGEDRDFTQWGPVSDNDISNDRCWRAACVQLCLSASPNDFLPEALGFNLAYESLPYHLLVSAREIEELLDSEAAYYFYLHISIDNSASGHSAMARMAVIDYIQAARKSGGDALADEMWARVKLGYALAEAVPTTPLLHEDDEDTTPEHLKSTAITAEDLDSTRIDAEVEEHKKAKRDAVIDILSKKAKSAAGLHASVTAQLAGRSISEWLDAKHFKERVPQLLDALSSSPVWIKKGDAEESRFVREFEWGGKMFGAMTGKEVSALKDWVSSLEDEEEVSVADNKMSQIPSDADVELPARTALRKYLFSHTAHPSTQWLDSSELRPLVMDQVCQSWSDLGTHLYSSIMKRPDAQRLPLSNQRDVLEQLAKASADIPAQLTSLQVKSLLPTLLLTTSPLEQVISASCGRLSSPLGMACVKVLRILLGFTETALPSSMDGDRKIGCMGTDDLEEDQKGVWEIIQELHGKLEGDEANLCQFVSRDSTQLGLPALMLHLGADVWRNMPILLGMTLNLTSTLLVHPSILASFEDKDTALQLEQIASRSSAWLEYAISLPSKGDHPRGVPDCDWFEEVELGRRLACSGINHIINNVE